MGEAGRALNRYYPVDSDPAEIRRRRRRDPLTVRFMLPISIRCSSCGNEIGPGTRFNSTRKEAVFGEEYQGIRVYRFNFNCTECSAGISMKTDPENSDYVVESGATRNLEPGQAGDDAEDEEIAGN